MVPAAASTAARAATDSGARPRLVCTSTPVALSTGRSDAGTAGSRSSTAGNQLVRGQRPAPHVLLGGGDRLLDQGPAEPRRRTVQPRVGEHGVGARDQPARVGQLGHRATVRRRAGAPPAPGLAIKTPRIALRRRNRTDRQYGVRHPRQAMTSPGQQVTVAPPGVRLAQCGGSCSERIWPDSQRAVPAAPARRVRGRHRPGGRLCRRVGRQGRHRPDRAARPSRPPRSRPAPAAPAATAAGRRRAGRRAGHPGPVHAAVPGAARPAHHARRRHDARPDPQRPGPGPGRERGDRQEHRRARQAVRGRARQQGRADVHPALVRARDRRCSTTPAGSAPTTRPRWRRPRCR